MDISVRKIAAVAMIAAAVLCASCRKASVQCDWQLTVQWRERASVTDPVPLATADVFAFHVDASQWTVASVEDARAGIITSVSDPSKTRTYDEAAVGGGSGGNVFRFHFDSSPVMIVVADRQHPMWATGNANVVPDMAAMYVTVTFTPLDWKEGDAEPKVVKSWKFYGYSEVDIPIDVRLEVVPSVRYDGISAAERYYDVGAYAYYGFGKSDDGRVTSWEQARSGRAERLVTLVEGDEENEPVREYREFAYDTEGEWRDDTLRMHLASDKVMVVAYSDEPVEPAFGRMYAYCFFDLKSNPVEEVSKLFFDLAAGRDEMVSGNWNIRFERPGGSTSDGE